MYTYLTAMILCDSCTEEARRAVKRCRIYKSFHFSFWGWMDFHAAVIDRSNSRITTNRSGKAKAKLLKNIFMKKIVKECKDS